MLKPRYATLSDSLDDFTRMLDGMNKVQPLERKFTDDMQEMLRSQQELDRLESQIDHAHRVSAGPGLQIDVTESDNLAAMHAHAADMYGQASVKAAEKVRDAISANNKAMAERFQSIVQKLREKAMAHQQQAKRGEKVVAESKQRQRSGLLENFRVLAGIEERPMLPRDPGVFGTTRFNAGYEAMAKPFAEANGSAVKPYSSDEHEKREKKDVEKIKKATKDLDKIHGDNVDEARTKEQQLVGLHRMAGGGRLPKKPDAVRAIFVNALNQPDAKRRMRDRIQGKATKDLDKIR